MNNSKLSIASLNNLALAYMSAGRTKDAIAAFEHLRDLQADALAEGDPDAQVALSNLGSTYLKDNQITKGIELLETASEGLSKSQGSEHARTLSAKNSLAKAYRMAKRHHEAIALLESVAPARRSLLGNDHRDTLITLHNLAIIYNELDQNNRAFPLFEEVRKRRVAKDPTARETLGTLLDLSNRYQKAGKLAAAANVLEELGHIQLKNGKAPDAAKTTAKCLELRQQQKLDDWETARIQILLGEALLADQEPAKAEISLAAGYANLKRHIGKAPTPERSTTLMHALDLMIRCAEANKHPPRASQLQVEKAAHQTMP